MEKKIFCYACEKETTFIAFDKWEPEKPTKSHCSTCGVYEDHNENELKQRYEKKAIGRPAIGITKRIALTLAPETMTAFETLAAEKEMKFAHLLRDAVEFYLANAPDLGDEKKNPKPTFTHEQIEKKYKEFVKEEFMSNEKGVKRAEFLPRFWIISVPEKDFKVSITCKCIGRFHGIEEWAAVVEDPKGEKSNYLLFSDEIEAWSKREREIRGIK